MSVNGYLFAAYAAVWTILFVYLVYLNQQQRQASRNLERLSRQLRDNPAEDH